MAASNQTASHRRSRLISSVRAVRANPTVAAVSAEGFLTRLGFSMVSFALPLFALHLGMKVSEIGLLYALRAATTLAVKPVMGWVADRFGRKQTLIVAVTLRCLVGVLFVFASAPWHLYLIRILHGAMTGARDPSAAALIAENGDRRRMASAFAWYATARRLGSSMGYAAAGLVLQLTGNYQGVFVFAFLTSCAALVMVIRYVRESPEVEITPAARPAAAAPAPRPWALYRSLLPFAGFGLMVAGSAEMMAGLFPVLATSYAHLRAGQAGIIVSVSSMAYLAAGPGFAWLSDHFSRKLSLGMRSVANITSSLMYIVFPGFAGFMVAKVVDDTGKAAFRPTWGAVLAEVSDSDPSRRAQTMTFVDSASTLGELLAPIGASFLLAGFGVPVMLGVRAVLAVATEIQAVRIFRKPKPVLAPVHPYVHRAPRAALDQTTSVAG